MGEAVWFEYIPLWAMFIAGLITVLSGIAVGFTLGTRLRNKNGTVTSPVSTVAGAMLGLLAFLLAFSFDIAASRFQVRREILLSEVNAIETTFLRADQIIEPERTKCRELLKRYVTIRASLSADKQSIRSILAESQVMQNQLWQEAVVLAKSKSNPEIDALFVASLNELIDLGTIRVTTALQYHIPVVIWAALFVLAFLSMIILGYQFGLTGKFSFICCIVAFGFSIAIMMIADFDSVTRGSLKVSQQPMIELRNRMIGQN